MLGQGTLRVNRGIPNDFSISAQGVYRFKISPTRMKNLKCG